MPRRQPTTDEEREALSKKQARTSRVLHRAENTRRIRQIMGLMARKQWSRDVAHELAAEWGITPGHCRDLAGQASRYLELMGERDTLMELVRTASLERLEDAQDRDYVPIARLLVDTVGGFESRHSVTVTPGQLPDTELVLAAAKELARTEEGRAAMRAALAAADETPLLEATVSVVDVVADVVTKGESDG